MYLAAFFCNNCSYDPEFNRVFSSRIKDRLHAQTLLFPHVITKDNFANYAQELREVEVIFATWGMWNLSPEQLDAMPNLKAVFYAAGTVKQFAPELLQRGIIVTSAWAANAVSVAQWTLAQILLATKGYWRNVNEYRTAARYDDLFRGRGNYGATVSILGAGQIGRRVIELLRPFDLRVLCFDPFLSHKTADVLGVEKVETLGEAFERGYVVSNHLADVPATVGMLHRAHFCLMPSHSTFINTGRGRTVNHVDLLEVMRARPDMTVLLDVTDPEPLPLAHPLRELSNVVISGHIAGSIGDEVERMGDFALQEFLSWKKDEPLRYEVSLEMLETMA